MFISSRRSFRRKSLGLIAACMLLVDQSQTRVGDGWMYGWVDRRMEGDMNGWMQDLDR